MRRKFKTKKKKKNWIFVVLFIFILFYLLFFEKIKNIEFTKTNEEFVNKLMYSTNHYLNYEKTNMFNNVVNSLIDVDFSKPVSLIKNEFKDKQEIQKFFVKNNSFKYSVYIYNTHQLEQYKKEEKYTPSVITSSKMLKEKLDKLNIDSLVDNSDLIEFMRVNNYTHAYSYVASKYFIEPVIKENDFDLIIDIHRDSIKKDASTVTINGKKYAKVLFVVGLEHDNYKYNLELTNKINSLIYDKYPTLTRGVYKKQGPGVDGIYNQDLSKKSILLELGGYENTIEEVNNTLDIIALIIQDYLGGLWKKKIEKKYMSKYLIFF